LQRLEVVKPGWRRKKRAYSKVPQEVKRDKATSVSGGVSYIFVRRYPCLTKIN